MTTFHPPPASVIVMFVLTGVGVGLFVSFNRLATTGGVPFIPFVFWESLIGGGAMLAILLVRRRLPGLSGAHLRAYAIIGGVGVSVPYTVMAMIASKLPARHPGPATRPRARGNLRHRDCAAHGSPRAPPDRGPSAEPGRGAVHPAARGIAPGAGDAPVGACGAGCSDVYRHLDHCLRALSTARKRRGGIDLRLDAHGHDFYGAGHGDQRVVVGFHSAAGLGRRLGHLGRAYRVDVLGLRLRDHPPHRRGVLFDGALPRKPSPGWAWAS